MKSNGRTCCKFDLDLELQGQRILFFYLHRILFLHEGTIVLLKNGKETLWTRSNSDFMVLDVYFT